MTRGLGEERAQFEGRETGPVGYDRGRQAETGSGGQRRGTRSVRPSASGSMTVTVRAAGAAGAR
jgi:hypothetical protein